MKENSILLIGIGNEFRGDDGVGIRVVRLVQQQIPKIDTLEVSSDILQVLDHWKNRSVVIVDAVFHPQYTPGDILIFKNIDEISLNQEVLTSSHNINLFEALELGKVLEKLPISILLIGVAGRSLSFENSLSKEVEDSIFKVIQIIRQRIS